MIRILFILENYYPNIGGVETLFKSLAESLAEKKEYKIQVLTNRFDDSLPKREEINGVEIIRLSLKNRYLFTFLAGFSAIKHARQNDIIHTTSYNAALPAIIASLFTKKKAIITFHEVWGKLWFTLPFMNKLSLLLHYSFEQFILNLPFKSFIAVSKYTKENLIQSGIPPEKIKLIYNGIKYEEFVPAVKNSKEVYQFCYFGRLGISKGLDILLEAISIAKDRGLGFRFVLILPLSPKAFLDVIKTRIDKLNISDFIIIQHELAFEDLKSEVSNSDAVVIPSYSEGFCFTAVESMALGVPIISSGKGALKEVVSGQYLEMKEHKASSLADCMENAINGDWQTKTPVKFPLIESISAYIRMYEDLI